MKFSKKLRCQKFATQNPGGNVHPLAPACGCHMTIGLETLSFDSYNTRPSTDYTALSFWL